MESTIFKHEEYDRESDLKAFDDAKTGVKGLVDAGIVEIPRIFRHPSANLIDAKPLSSVSPPQLTIPTIDLDGMLHGDSNTRKNLVDNIREAAEKWGFFQVINHGIPSHVLEEMNDGVVRFHEQDPEVKKGFYTRDPTKKVVYNSNFDLYSSPAATWRDTFGCYLSPDPPRLEDMPTTCRDIMMEFGKGVMKVAELLFELLSEALGLMPNHLKDMDCAKALLMLCHYYPPCPQPDLTLGLSKHSDNSFLTVVLQDNNGGLQVLHGDNWVDVPPVPGALVVNVGDLLQLITNDKFISAEHRVLAKRGNGPRTSVACFFSTYLMPNSRLYGPMKELVSEQNPAKYRDTTITEFAAYYRAKGHDGTSALLHLRI
ncbi:PREDICTED: 1-aminocyclopropane-1-carboxylate oxidase homolog 1-like [Tarenaya hassleriana]|uniref:1-aminocyclopropane-1-carboxylate oxidase homolog 1-like n=1 Tax=Tarenaya hassleriana TaxID=28532 RepID=UPI00053C17FC|nr:PREDICTED: 1-aminocyclopropane-1-carboxylate oxidase homolog 1-like [Tarenaya hassleriana]